MFRLNTGRYHLKEILRQRVICHLIILLKVLISIQCVRCVGNFWMAIVSTYLRCRLTFNLDDYGKKESITLKSVVVVSHPLK
jgi:hypothetical protein